MKKSTEVLHYVKQNLLLSSCYASLGVLAVSGTAFVVQDYQNQNNIEHPAVIASNQDHNENEVEKPQEKVEEPVDIQSPDMNEFTPVPYEQTQLNSAREAYYVCLNFAITQAEFEQKSKQELLAIKPVYEELKASNSSYYQLLEQSDWSTLYTSVLTK